MSQIVLTSPEDLRELVADAVHAVLSDSKSARGSEPEQVDKAWLSNREAMDYLDLSKATLQRYRTDGILPYSKIEGSIFYRREDLHRVLEQSRVSS